MASWTLKEVSALDPIPCSMSEPRAAKVVKLLAVEDRVDTFEVAFVESKLLSVGANNPRSEQASTRTQRSAAARRYWKESE